MTLIANYSLVSFNSARNTLPKVPRPIWLINSNYYNVILVGRLDHIINDFFSYRFCALPKIIRC